MSKPKIAFICVHNSCRSQIAEAFGKVLAADVFESYSAGTETKPQINQDAVRLMKELYGIDMEKTQYSKLISAIPKPDIAISMGCNVSCPFIGRPFDENWGLDDPTGKSDDEFKAVIEQILSNLTSGEGHYELVKLKDAAYQERLDSQRAYWERLKAEVTAARQRGYENTQIVAMSETYFEMADETVSAAEHYSEKIAMKIRTIEILSALDMLCLVILIMLQTAMALKMARKNQLLEQKAYIDIHTGLPNKGSCEELLNNREILREPTACVIFDLNNLKTVNDTRGHSAGDQLILSFARLLRRVIPEKHFVGRYGGDEFMAVIYHTDRQEVEGILDSLRREADAANRDGNQLPLSYAYGWAISADYEGCIMQTLLDKADYCMYENKRAYYATHDRRAPRP